MGYSPPAFLFLINKEYKLVDKITQYFKTWRKTWICGEKHGSVCGSISPTFLPDCTLMWGLHTAQLCRVARDISEPRHSLLCPATSRATDHQPQWGTSIFEGVQHPFLSTPTTSGRFGPAVTDLFHILQWPHSQVLPFREALVQPMLSHHLLEEDNRPEKHNKILSSEPANL